MRIRSAIIGCGSIAEVHYKALSSLERVEIIGAVNRGEEKGRLFALSHGIRYFATLDELLSQRIDLVLIATPPSTHLEIARKCIEGSVRAIIIEKPVCMNKEECDALLDLEKTSGTLISVFFQSRFFPSVSVIKKALDEKRLGQLSYFMANVLWYRDPSYFSSSPYKGFYKNTGGGVLMSQAIHAIDLLLYFAGEVESFKAYKTSLFHQVEVEDNASVAILFKNGALGSINASISSWPGESKRISIYGSRGTICMQEDSITEWSFSDERPEDAEIRRIYGRKSSSGGYSDPMAINYEYHMKVVENVINAMEKKEKLLITLSSASKSVGLISDIYASS